MSSRAARAPRRVAAVGAGVRRADRPGHDALARGAPGLHARPRAAAPRARSSSRSRSSSARSSSIRGFAAAATTLSTVYGNLGEGSKSIDYARLAYASREHVSERERLFIGYQYHDRVTGDQRQAADTLEVWKRTYPNDFRPANALAIIHNRLGEYERGVAEAQEALARSPGHPFAAVEPRATPIAASAATRRRRQGRRGGGGAGRRDGADAAPPLPARGAREGRRDEAARQLEWAKGKPREFDLVAAQAQVAAYEGRLRERGRAVSRERRSSPSSGGCPRRARAYVAHAALAHALYGHRAARSRWRGSRSPPARGRDSTDGRARGSARSSSLGLLGAPEAARIADAVVERYPPDSTVVNGVLLPTARAAIELSAGPPGGGRRGAARGGRLRDGQRGGADPRVPAGRGLPAPGGRPLARSSSSAGS